MRWQPCLLVLVGACGGAGGDPTIAITHDVCAPIFVISAAPTAAQAQGIDDALALWRSHGVGAIVHVESDAPEPASDAPIDIQFERAAGAFHGLYDDQSGLVYINEDVVDPNVLPIVIAHELGHAFGLVHVTGRPSLMNPGNLHVLPTADDEAALVALWGTCAPIASSVPPGS